MDFTKRTELLLQKEGIANLAEKKVAVLGLGGVGGYVVEILARSGIGHLVLIDNDTVDVTNINRQIIAVHSTVGKPKCELFETRCRDINPEIKITGYQKFYLPGQNQEYMFSDCDYVVDAIDTITGKLGIIEYCKNNNIPVISVMGTGNKLNPELLQISDIAKTSVCPLARVMRRELKQRNIKNLDVVFSTEQPIKLNQRTPGSVPFVPSVAGIMVAGFVVRKLAR